MAPRLIPSTASAYHYPLLIKQLLVAPMTHSLDQEILYSDVSRYTYRTLRERIGKLANALSALGVESGQTVAISGASAQSSAITATQVDVTADTACFVALGNNPTAALNTSYRIPAGVGPIRLGLTSGDKIAVIGTAGNLWIHPVGEL